MSSVVAPVRISCALGVEYPGALVGEVMTTVGGSVSTRSTGSGSGPAPTPGCPLVGGAGDPGLDADGGAPGLLLDGDPGAFDDGKPGSDDPGGSAPGLLRMLHVKSWVAETPAAFATVIVTGYVPIVVGLPEMRPVAWAIDKPGGSPDAVYCNERPAGSFAATCTATAWPTAWVMLPGLPSAGPLTVAFQLTSADSELVTPPFE